MNKQLKILLSVFIVLLILIGSGFVWFWRASINYSFNYDFYYKNKDGNWYTVNWINNNQTDGSFVSVNCYNHGLMDGTFSIIVGFTNATLSNQTSKLYLQMSNSTAKFPITLHGHEQQYFDVYFNVDSDVTSFEVKLAFESSQILIHSIEGNPHNVNTMQYFLNETDDSFLTGPQLQ